MERIARQVENAQDRIINRPATWFGMVPAWICEYAEQLGPEGLAIFMVLCIHANKERRCFPSQERLAKETGCSIDTVRRRIHLLEELNLVRTLTKGGSAKDGSRWASVYEIVDRLVLAPLAGSKGSVATPSREHGDPLLGATRPLAGSKGNIPIEHIHEQKDVLKISSVESPSNEVQTVLEAFNGPSEEERIAQNRKAIDSLRERLRKDGVLGPRQKSKEKVS